MQRLIHCRLGLADVRFETLQRARLQLHGVCSQRHRPYRLGATTALRADSAVRGFAISLAMSASVAHQAEILAWSGEAGTAVAKSLQSVIWIVLIPVLAIFFVRDGRQFSATLLHTFGELNQRRFLRLIMTDLDVMLAHFIRAQLILAGISLVAYSVVLSVLRFPYALVLGFAAGAMEFIPVVGPLVAALAIVFVGFLTAYPHLWALILFFACWRVVQDYVLSPRVMGGTLELHPLAAIVAVLMGGELGGVDSTSLMRCGRENPSMFAAA